jgi:hypothetical protein
LRFLQSGIEAEAAAAHPREDVVAGSVDDPGEARDPVADEGFAEGANDGDPPTDCAFEGEIDAAGLRNLEELWAALGEKHLVRRDDAPTGSQGAFDERARRIETTHYLDDDVDRRVAEDRFWIGRHARAIELGDALTGGIADENARDLEGRANTRGERAMVLRKEPDDAATDSATTQKTDSNRRRWHIGVIIASGTPRELT